MNICELGLTLPCGNLKLDEGFVLTDSDVELNLGVPNFSSALPCDLPNFLCLSLAPPPLSPDIAITAEVKGRGEAEESFCRSLPALLRQ